MCRFKVLVCLALFGLFGNRAQAQFYRSSNLSFGRSRIQYSPFYWSFYRIHSADIYYYPQSQSLAIFTARQADSLIRQMEKKTHYQAKHKLQIIIFAKYADYQQSNIQWKQDETYYQSGWTPLYNHKILIYYDGDMRHFQEHLQSGIAQWMVNQLMLEQSIPKVFPSFYLMLYSN